MQQKVGMIRSEKKGRWEGDSSSFLKKLEGDDFFGWRVFYFFNLEIYILIKTFEKFSLNRLDIFKLNLLQLTNP